MASYPQWRDVPPELLLKIATSGGGIQNLMRGACKTWKTGLEASCTQLTIIDSALLQDLGARFTALSKLDLQCCDPAPTPQSLHALGALPSLTSLSLKFASGQLTQELLGALSGLPIAILVLELGVEEITDSSMDTLRLMNLARLDFELLHRGRVVFTDAHLRRLAELPITQLDISDTAVTDAGMPALRDLPLLNSLDCSALMRVGSLHDTGLAELRGLPLTSLRIGGSDEITDEGMQAVIRMPLTNLDLSECSISHSGLGVLRGMPLSSLNLCDCSEISDLAVLHGLSLTRLDLEGLGRVINGSFYVVRDMPLTDLTLHDFATDEALLCLRGKQLTRLELGSESVFTGVGLDVLKGMPLTDLRASMSNCLTGEVLRGAPLKRLEVVGFTDSDLDALRGMELIDLHLWGSDAVTDSGLDVLRGMPLKSIRISSGQKLTDAGLEVLRGMALEDLFLHNCPHITDSGLQVLLGMPLKGMYVFFCGATTEEGVRRVAGNST